jgi:HSP20 family molecular chaperone IbpA
LIEVDLPGVPPEQVEIRVTEGCLTISKKHQAEQPPREVTTAGPAGGRVIRVAIL